MLSDKTGSLLPIMQKSALMEDVSPDTSISIGLRVYVHLGGKVLFGKIQSIRYKNVTIFLDEKFMRRHVVTVNWKEVRMETAESRKMFMPKDKNEQRANRLISINRAKEYLVSIEKSQNTESFDHESRVQARNSLLLELQTLSSALKEFSNLSEFIMQQRARVLDIQGNCMQMGIEDIDLPDYATNEEFLFSNAKMIQKKTNRSKKVQLKKIREQTRTLLSHILKASGPEGMDSRDIIQAMIEYRRESTPQPEPGLDITSHRIMGMLSALSRSQEAEMIGSNRWRAVHRP
jgi:hypothetical protein